MAFDENTTIVLSGHFEQCDRDGLFQIITTIGCKLSGCISKRTTLLVIGMDADQSKVQRAKELHIPILTEKEFWSRISEQFPSDSRKELCLANNSPLIIEEPLTFPEAKKISPITQVEKSNIPLKKIPFAFDLKTAADVKRYNNAIKIKKSAIRVDKDAERAIITGSSYEPYQTSLRHCTCMDYSMLNRPCKHMIRLAIELGYNLGIPEFNPEKAAQVDFDKETEHFYELWREGCLLTEAYISCLIALEKAKEKAK